MTQYSTGDWGPSSEPPSEMPWEHIASFTTVWMTKLSSRVRCFLSAAMKMEGGGTFGLEAGQFTDDSELATHLLKGLSKFNENEQLS